MGRHMKMNDTAPVQVLVNPSTPLSTEDRELLTEQLREAFPSATERLLHQAIDACRLESEDPDDRQKLIRCVVERITA